MNNLFDVELDGVQYLVIRRLSKKLGDPFLRGMERLLLRDRDIDRELSSDALKKKLNQIINT